MKTIEQLNSELDAKIPASAISSRSGGGKALSYLETHYVIDRLNKTFGNMGWDSETLEMTLLPGGDKPSYRAKVRITAVAQVGEGQYLKVVKEGTGFGSDKNSLNPHEMACKEAESDALKRAAMKFGMSLGLALYDKDKTNVEDDSGARPPAGTGNAANRPKLAEAPPAAEPRPQAPQSNRPVLNGNINTASKIVVQMKKKTIDELKGMMREKYGTDDKEKLTDAQAQEFLAELNKLVS